MVLSNVRGEMIMFRITQCAAPLASLFLLATGFAFVGTTAAKAVSGTAPTAMEQKTPEAGDASQKCTPTKTRVRC